jgi:hypothetical protein
VPEKIKMIGKIKASKKPVRSRKNISVPPKHRLILMVAASFKLDSYLACP